MLSLRPSASRALVATTLAAALGAPFGLQARSVEPGLLFHLSADHGTTADYSAAGAPEPTFVDEVDVIPDGARGRALRCHDTQRLAWRAPGHVYARRGTVSFFWRARTPLGPTAFPLFRIAFADHSSWDMVFLRLDYNGRGFDAFVTDTGLARIRVSTTIAPRPAPEAWTHLAFAWDEDVGVRLYVDGRLVAATDQAANLDAGLDQFGPHSRLISPHNVQSDYNFIRGGDLDELRLHDRMLDAAAVAALAGHAPAAPSPLPASPATATAALRPQLPTSTRPPLLPPSLPAPATVVRKVEIHDAHDLGRWWWKACDGIRETTWPGVYNRSRLPGRTDYFVLPDWDCYVESGRAVTFTLPAEPVNHLEITGPAAGTLRHLPAAPAPDACGRVGPCVRTAAAGVGAVTPGGSRSAGPTLLERNSGAEKTVHRLGAPLVGGALRFENAEPETPLAEFAAYHVAPGTEPAGRPSLAYRIAFAAPADPATKPLRDFIAGRHPAGERALVTAVPANSPVPPGPGPTLGGLPFLHVAIPPVAEDPAYNLAQIDGALDGIALDLPTFGTSAPVALTIRVKDPLWPARDLADFSCTVAPDRAHTLWLDLRDRLLPPGAPLYLTLAASAPLDPSALAPGIRLVFKAATAGRAEHTADRFAQVRDAFAMWVEERPRSPKYALYRRLVGDLRDLLRVEPAHFHGLCYAAALGLDTPRPPFTQPRAPAGTPLWAFRQTELLKRLQYFADWYVDHRQSAFGDLGGGISDDTDLTNCWPGLALMGCAPEKLADSVARLLEAAYANGMFDRGLCAIQTDELHSYEEGLNCLGQNLILAHGSPRQLERAMETTRALFTLTGVNAAGHRHLRSSYFSGSTLATEGVWGWARPYGYLQFQIPALLADYNGSPEARRLVQETADGLLAHRRRDAAGEFHLPAAIHFETDAEADATRNWLPWPLFWNAWQWTGDRRYLAPVFDLGVTGVTELNANALDLLDLRVEWGPRLLAGERGRPVNFRRIDRRGSANGAPTAKRPPRPDPHFAWQLTGDKTRLEELYAAQLEYCALNEFINTEGSLWIDRPAVPLAEIQRARLGGIALLRNAPFPGHAVSWRFAAPARAADVAILVPRATATELTILAHNLSAAPVRAELTGWAVAPGTWTATQGVDTDGDDRADRDLAERTAPFGRAQSLDLALPPHATAVLTLRLATPGTPYWARPDLGLDPQDIVRAADTLQVTVHSLGAVAAPPTTVALLDPAGRTVATATTPPLPAPIDLHPKTATVTLPLPPGLAPAGYTVRIDPASVLEEISLRNNAVRLE